jgi:hypothetical protein
MTQKPDRDALPASDVLGGRPPGVPRWLKVSAVVMAAVIVLVLIGMVLVGGDHGPGRHLGAGVSLERALLIGSIT